MMGMRKVIDMIKEKNPNVAIMLGGHIVQRGSAAEVQGRPRCPFVARFLGLEPSSIATLPACAHKCDEKPGECLSEEAS